MNRLTPLGGERVVRQLLNGQGVGTWTVRKSKASGIARRGPRRLYQPTSPALDRASRVTTEVGVWPATVSRP